MVDDTKFIPNRDPHITFSETLFRYNHGRDKIPILGAVKTPLCAQTKHVVGEDLRFELFITFGLTFSKGGSGTPDSGGSSAAGQT